MTMFVHSTADPCWALAAQVSLEPKGEDDKTASEKEKNPLNLYSCSNEKGALVKKRRIALRRISLFRHRSLTAAGGTLLAMIDNNVDDGRSWVEIIMTLPSVVVEEEEE